MLEEAFSNVLLIALLLIKILNVRRHAMQNI